jgi:hypothetical protein
MLGSVTRERLSSALFALFASVATFCTSCSEETRKCHALMTTAQGIVNGVDSKDISSVEHSLSAVESALAACQAAGRATEVDELTRAKNELAAHRDYLSRKANEPKRRKRTDEELAELVRHGDPDCPKGQMYKDATTRKDIRCTGAEPVDMAFRKAQDYFNGRGYKTTTTPSPPTLEAEYGAELWVYTYTTADDPGPPRCLTLYPPPDMSWQEATARATGTPPQRLDKADSVKTDHGIVPLHVESTDKKVVVRIGDCG